MRTRGLHRSITVVAAFTGTLAAGLATAYAVKVASTPAPPTVTFTGGPTNYSVIANSGHETFAFTTTTTARFRCQLDQNAPTPCVSGVTYDGLANGQHELTVVATMSSGQTTAPAQVVWWEAPGDATTGVPVAMRGNLTPYNGDLHVTAAGTTVSGLDIHGFVTIEAPNVTIKDCKLEGGVAPTMTPLVLITNENASHFLLEDSTLVPAHPSVNIDGIKGSNYTAERVNI